MQLWTVYLNGVRYGYRYGETEEQVIAVAKKELGLPHHVVVTVTKHLFVVS